MKVLLIGSESTCRAVASPLAADGVEVRSLICSHSTKHERSAPFFIAEREAFDLIIPLTLRVPTALPSSTNVIFPNPEGQRLEADRLFSVSLCNRFGIPCANSNYVRNATEAKRFLDMVDRGYVIKNPFCPAENVATTICHSVQESTVWLDHMDFSEGLFLQQYIAGREIGHTAFVNGCNVTPLATNREYKRPFANDAGPMCPTPVAGVVQLDSADEYGLCKQLIAPLSPWFEKIRYRGFVQATAIWHNQTWNVIEYNVRLGVTTGPLLLRQIVSPSLVLRSLAGDAEDDIEERPSRRWGCSIAMLNVSIDGRVAKTPISIPKELSDDFAEIIFHESSEERMAMRLTDNWRPLEVLAFSDTRQEACFRAYDVLNAVHCPGGVFKMDIGSEEKWP